MHVSILYSYWDRVGGWGRGNGPERSLSEIMNYVDVYRNKVNVQLNFCCCLALFVRCPGDIHLVDSSAIQ